MGRCLATAAALYLMLLTAPAYAATFCGAGVITSINTEVQGVATDPANLVFKVDNSINGPAGNAAFATVNGSSNWMSVGYDDATRFNFQIEAVQKAYLAGLPVRVWNYASDNNCGRMTSTNMSMQVCSSSSDCSSTGAPH